MFEQTKEFKPSSFLDREEKLNMRKLRIED